MSQSPKSTSSSVFLDANVLLEVLLARRHETAARRVLQMHAGNMYISALTAHLVVHFGQQCVSLDVLQNFLGDYQLLELTATDFTWAFTNLRGSDFKDALQLAVAVRQGLPKFLTFDKELHRLYRDLPTIDVVLLR